MTSKRYIFWIKLKKRKYFAKKEKKKILKTCTKKYTKKKVMHFDKEKDNSSKWYLYSTFTGHLYKKYHPLPKVCPPPTKIPNPTSPHKKKIFKIYEWPVVFPNFFSRVFTINQPPMFEKRLYHISAKLQVKLLLRLFFIAGSKKNLLLLFLYRMKKKDWDEYGIPYPPTHKMSEH